MNRSWFYSVVVLAVLLVPESGSAAAQSFRPKFVSMTSVLNVKGRYREYERASSFSTTNNSALDIRESINFSTLWYSYHPRFFVFTLGGNIGVGQASNETNGNGASNTSALEEYNFEGTFLPEHLYNLRLFYDQNSPMLTSGYSADQTREQTHYGTEFAYAKRPWLANLKYEDKTAVSSVKSENSQLRGRLSYDFEGAGSVGGAFSHNTGQRGNIVTRGDDTRGTLRFRRKNYDNALEWMLAERAYGDNLARRYMLEDDLDIDLPLGFDLGLEAATEADRTYENDYSMNEVVTGDRNDFKALLTHQLYASLNSRMNVSASQRGNGNGDSRALRYLIGTKYKKDLFWKGELFFDVSTTRGDTERDYTASDIDLREIFANQDPAKTFTTSAAEIEFDSVKVAVRNQKCDQDDPNAYVELANIHYTKAQTYNLGVQITIIASTAELQQLIKDGPNCVVTQPTTTEDTYDFRVSYRIIPGNYQVAVTGFNHRTDVYLKDRLLHWYYSEGTATQKKKRGEFTLGYLASNVLQKVWGIDVSKAPFTTGYKAQEDVADRDRQRSWQAFTQLDYPRQFSENQYGFLTLRASHNAVTEKVISGKEEPLSAAQQYLAKMTYAAMLPYVSLQAATGGHMTSRPLVDEGYENSLRLSTLLPKVDIRVIYYGVYSSYRKNSENDLTFSDNSSGNIIYARTQDKTNTDLTTFDNQLFLERAFPDLRMRSTLKGAYTIRDYSYESTYEKRQTDNKNVTTSSLVTDSRNVESNEWTIEAFNQWTLGSTSLELRALYGIFDEFNSGDLAGRESSRTEVFFDLRRPFAF